MKKTIVILTLLAMSVWQANAAVQYKVDVYEGFTASGDGFPFSTLNSTVYENWIVNADGKFIAPNGYDIAPSEANMNWHPANLGRFGAVITATINSPHNDYYNFRLYSDDGSALYIDGILVVDDTGSHSPLQTDFKQAFLTQGNHSVQINFFEDFGGPSGLTATFDCRLTPVPEPSTYIAGLSALCLLGLFSRESRK